MQNCCEYSFHFQCNQLTRLGKYTHGSEGKVHIQQQWPATNLQGSLLCSLCSRIIIWRNERQVPDQKTEYIYYANFERHSSFAFHGRRCFQALVNSQYLKKSSYTVENSEGTIYSTQVLKICECSNMLMYYKIRFTWITAMTARCIILLQFSLLFLKGFLIYSLMALNFVIHSQQVGKQDWRGLLRSKLESRVLMGWLKQAKLKFLHSSP